MNELRRAMDSGFHSVNERLTKLMAGSAAEQALLDSINQATNKQALALTRQGAAIATLASSQTQLSTELDDLIQKIQTGSIDDPAVLDALQKQSAASSQMADALTAQAQTLEDQATFSTLLASKGTANVVPGTVPTVPDLPGANPPDTGATEALA